MMKGARKYDKRIGIGTTVEVADGFGGVQQGIQVASTSRWAMVRKPSKAGANNYFNQFGLKEDDVVREFTFRMFDFDISSQYLVYKGNVYSPVAVQDVDEYEVETVIIARKVVE